MGFRFRKSFKAGPFRATVSKSGISTSMGGKGFRVTKTARGTTRTTISIPGSGISYTSESKSDRKKATTPKASSSCRASTSYKQAQEVKCPANPPKPPKSPAIYRVCGIILIVAGVICLPFALPLGVIFAALGIYYVTCGLKIYAKLVDNYKAAHPDFEESKK